MPRSPRDPVPEGQSKQALLHLRKLILKLSPTVNEHKARICKVLERECASNREAESTDAPARARLPPRRDEAG
jgi:hypothetical protein